MTKPSEASITRSILRYLNGLDGCRAIKTHGGPLRGGEPDIYAVKNGQFYALEVKRPGGKATKLQAAILDQWSAAGAVAAVVTSVEEAKEVLGE